jgi:hypothetical protein
LHQPDGLQYGFDRVQAFSADYALVTDGIRAYRTSDGGRTWRALGWSFDRIDARFTNGGHPFQIVSG